MECVDDEVAENERLSGGQAKIAGVGEVDGDGDEPRVKGGEFESLLSVADNGLRFLAGEWEAFSSWSYIV